MLTHFWYGLPMPSISAFSLPEKQLSENFESFGLSIKSTPVSFRASFTNLVKTCRFYTHI